MTKREKAMTLFKQGYNCAQSVLLAFCDELGLTPTDAARLSLPFGGGMGQLRETCGALTGAFMVLGLQNTTASPPTPGEKAAVYQKVRDFAEEFRSANGSGLCRDLLALAGKNNVPKNCCELVGNAAEQLEQFMLHRS